MSGRPIPRACRRVSVRRPSPAERVATLEAEKAELKDRMLRIAAEFDNYKKRMRKEVTEHEVKAREAVLREFLEIADNPGACRLFLEGRRAKGRQVRSRMASIWSCGFSSRSWNAIR